MILQQELHKLHRLPLVMQWLLLLMQTLKLQLLLQLQWLLLTLQPLKILLPQ